MRSAATRVTKEIIRDEVKATVDAALSVIVQIRSALLSVHSYISCPSQASTERYNPWGNSNGVPNLFWDTEPPSVGTVIITLWTNVAATAITEKNKTQRTKEFFIIWCAC
jgi:hypothetical protein